MAALGWGTSRRSFFLAFFIACGDCPCNLKRYKIVPPINVSKTATSEKLMVLTPFPPLDIRGAGNSSRNQPFPAPRYRQVGCRLRFGHSAFAAFAGG